METVLESEPLLQGSTQKPVQTEDLSRQGDQIEEEIVKESSNIAGESSDLNLLLKEKDAEIQQLKEQLEKVTKERDELKQQLSEALSEVPTYEPVANPLQTALVNYLVNIDALTSKTVEEVMRSIDRGDFAPKDAYVDRPQMIGFNTTVSAPHMHALQLELMKDCFKGAKKALDIGTGSGYMALAIAKMMKSEDIKVYGIDHIPKLIDQAKENVAKHHSSYLESGKIEFLVADGREGLPQFGPYDLILVGGAIPTLTNELLDQLSLGGCMVAPVGDELQKLMVVHKNLEGAILKNPVLHVAFGKLQSVEEQCPDIDE